MFIGQYCRFCSPKQTADCFSNIQASTCASLNHHTPLFPLFHLLSLFLLSLFLLSLFLLSLFLLSLFLLSLFLLSLFLLSLFIISFFSSSSSFPSFFFSSSSSYFSFSSPSFSPSSSFSIFSPSPSLLLLFLSHPFLSHFFLSHPSLIFLIFKISSPFVKNELNVCGNGSVTYNKEVYEGVVKRHDQGSRCRKTRCLWTSRRKVLDLLALSSQCLTTFICPFA